MKLGAHIEQYRQWAESYVTGRGYTLGEVKAGIDAWTIAHKAGITNHAYGLSRDVYDSHIQTALEKIFPNVKFRDAKRY